MTRKAETFWARLGEARHPKGRRRKVVVWVSEHATEWQAGVGIRIVQAGESLYRAY